MKICFDMRSLYAVCSCVTQSNSLCMSMLLQDIKKFNGMVEWTFNRLRAPLRSCHMKIDLWCSLPSSSSTSSASCVCFFFQSIVAKVHVLLHRLKNGWKHKVPCKLPNFEQINTSTEKWMPRWHSRPFQWFRLMRFFWCMYTKYYVFDVVYTNASTRNSCDEFFFLSFFSLSLIFWDWYRFWCVAPIFNDWIWFIGLSSVRV